MLHLLHSKADSNTIDESIFYGIFVVVLCIIVVLYIESGITLY